MKRQGLENKLIMAASAFFAAAMVVFPAVTESGSKTAIVIWANSIIPILLPFFIFSDFIRRVGNLERIPLRIYPFVIAFMSGYPMGAKIVGDLTSLKYFTNEEGKFVLSYSLITGPAFIIGTAGAFLGSGKAAAVVAASHYLGAVLNGFLYRCKGEKRLKTTDITESTHCSSPSYMDSFTASIIAGFKAMAVILAYLILFMIGMELLESIGVFGLFPGEPWSAFAKGIIEMTVGANMIGLCNISIGLKTALTAFIVSFGGLSVIGQSVSMASGSGLGFGTILQIKLTHGLIAGSVAAAAVFFLL
ncbi:MAG: hypothetical protein PUD12_02555 [Firmicutes bacterium]|nr:hypothetical protein [Bacillota bacterium]